MEQLKKFRKQQKLTAEAFAKKIDMSISLYQKVENDNRKPSRNFITKLKKVYPEFDANIFFGK